MNTTQITSVSPQELVDLITESFKSQFEAFSIQPIEKKPTEHKEFLTRRETSEFLKVSLVTIHEWSKNRIIKPYKLGNRTYFKYSELLETLYQSNRA